MNTKTAILPTSKEIKAFLDGYGWTYKETPSDDGKEVVVSSFSVGDKSRGILVSFVAEGEFVLVSTIELLKNVPSNFSQRFLELNDTVKLVKLYTVTQNNPDTIDVDLGFELWNESWNKKTFYSFMDMLCLGAEKALNIVNSENIPHETNFITYS